MLIKCSTIERHALKHYGNRERINASGTQSTGFLNPRIYGLFYSKHLKVRSSDETSWTKPMPPLKSASTHSKNVSCAEPPTVGDHSAYPTG